MRRNRDYLGLVAGLLVLGLLLQVASPGFTMGALARQFPGTIGKALDERDKKNRGVDDKDRAGTPVAGIPNSALGLYRATAGGWWATLAGLYKVESNHGQSDAPGVKKGVNRFGCCAGPGQFNIKAGTDRQWFRPGQSVYRMEDAVPATWRMLRHYYRQKPGTKDWRGDDCPAEAARSSRAWVNAIKHYNNACWYIREILDWRDQYSKRPPHGITFTTSHGCNPKLDWTHNRIAPALRGILVKLSVNQRIRISCLKTGHSFYVKGTRRQSAHSDTPGRGADIDMVDGKAVSPANPRADVGREAVELGANNVGGPRVVCNRGCFNDEGHNGHWHIGVAG